MYKIVFYRTESGKEPVLDFIRALKKRKDKDGRINSEKVNDYIEILKICGKSAGEPYVKHLSREIATHKQSDSVWGVGRRLFCVASLFC